ncbi:MAG: glycosyltransferase family 39 protein [Chloroflexi bacterium]|nr:glycosyltransferase family 39 protein [Chloroflexota bacterium]
MNDRFFWPTERRHRWLLVGIILLGAALRLWLWWRSPLHQPANDETEYVQVARDLINGRGWRFYDTYHWLRAPLYPLWLAGSLWLFDNFRLASLPNIALSIATIYLFYLLGRDVGLSGRESDPDRVQQAERVGLSSAASSALLLTLSTFASLWMSETLFTALFAGSLLLLLRCAARPRWWLALGAGVLMGLAILTRSSPMPMVPFAALWLIITVYRHMRAEPRPVAMRRATLYGVGFGLCCALVIAPWTIRNYLAYGEPIPVETGLSFNIWRFNEPREDEATIFKVLEEIPNPAARADYATAKGLERLREDPAILLRKLWPNWNAIWMIKPIEDRFLLPTYYQDVPLNMFVLALLLDDGLYVVLALLSLWGLLCAPLDRRKILLGGWVLSLLVVVLFTHGEGRYRQFIFPALLPYAGWQILMLRREWSRIGVRRLAYLAGIVVALWTALVTYYPREWAMRNLRRAWDVQQAQWALNGNDTATAIKHLQQANNADPRSADVWLALGAVYQQIGLQEEALKALENAYIQMPSYVTVNLLRGDSLRRLGRDDEAREAFKGFYNDEQQMLDWAWTDLDPPRPEVVEVGDGLDFGLVSGMHPAEMQERNGEEHMVRWTDKRAAIRLTGSATGTRINLTLAAQWPNAQPVPIRVCVNGSCRELVLDAEWRDYWLTAPAAPEYLITIDTPTFDPQQFDPESEDQRRLGILVDRAAVLPFTP